MREALVVIVGDRRFTTTWWICWHAKVNLIIHSAALHGFVGQHFEQHLLE
jgi:hypothetical protein